MQSYSIWKKKDIDSDVLSQKNLAKRKRPKDTLMRYSVLLISQGILDYDKESTVYQGRTKKDPRND
jgi:hypothetical protein